MVRALSDDRVRYIAKESHLPSGKVKMVLTLNKEYSENHKKLPKQPAPEGGISIRAAARKYAVSNQTISRWVKRSLVPILSRTKNWLYIDEAILRPLIEKYKQSPGQGKKTV